MADDQNYTSQFKAKVALETIRGERTVEEIAKNYGIDPRRVEKWREILKSRSETLFIELEGETDIPNYQFLAEDESADKLRQTISLLRATLNATVNGILVVDLEGHIVTYNRRFLEMWNLPEHIMVQGKDEIAIRHVLEQVKDPESFKERIEELYNEPEMTSQDIIHFKDGKIFERTSFPHKIGDRIIGRVWSFMDITAHKQARDKLERFGKLLESINANIGDGILRSTPEEGLIYVNDAFVDMFGYTSKEEVFNTDPEEFYDNPERRWELLELLYNEKSYNNEEILFRRKDGSIFWGLESSTLVESNDQTYIDAVVKDITHRKKVEEELRISEEKYRTILENIEDGYFETDLAGNLTFFNEALKRMFGYPEEKLMGMNNRDYMDEANAESVYETFNRVYRTGEAEKGFEWEIISQDGKKHVVEASISLKRNSNGKPVGFRGIVRDITQRKEQEKQIKASLKEKEVLLGEIHHRVKNNLAVISGLLFLQAEQTEDNNASDLLMQSQSRINSMALIHEMLYDNQTFSRVNPENYIHQLINEIAGNMKPADKDISIEVETGQILIDMNIAVPCALIINELMTNAFKYAFKDRKEGTIKIKFDIKKDKYILQIADDGVGIQDKQQAEKGLGLFLVKELVRQINGELFIEGNGGTTATITFPAGGS